MGGPKIASCVTGELYFRRGQRGITGEGVSLQKASKQKCLKAIEKADRRDGVDEKEKKMSRGEGKREA